MKKLTDKQLIQELQRRFEENIRSVRENSELMDELREVNARLQESEKLKSHFLSNIRNEINNPLASILGLSKSILTMKAKDWKKVKFLTTLFHAEAFNLDFQLKNIFAAAELEAGETFPEITNVEIDLLIQGIIDFYQHSLELKNISIVYGNEMDSGENNNFFFKTDPLKLQLIFSNLLNNAITFSGIDSEIKIRSWNQDDKLYISVQDFGAGIHKLDRTKIFERFKQLDGAVANKGHGLGLAVSQALLEIINGEMEVESSKDQGSTFIIRIDDLNPNDEVDGFTMDANQLFFEGDEKF